MMGFLEITDPMPSRQETVPETDTGGRVEKTQALERMMLKELGKLPSYLRKKRDLP